MRVVFLVGFLALAATANAADCENANTKLITISDWSAKKGEFLSTDIELKLKNNGPKQIRMMKASAVFTDPFGDNVANLGLDPDVVIAPNAIYVEQGSWSAARLAKVRKQDVTVTICVTAVLYEDGSKEEFK